ncbi:MAG: YceI family protein [Ferruginibacter sp.]
MKTLFSIAAILLITANVSAQKVYTKNGSISFYSKTSMENIDAKNDQVMCVLNQQTGDLQFSVIIKAFHFEKALMEEHFNENYMESTKFPKATFKGLVDDISKIDFTKDGVYNVKVSGDLTVHGVTNKESAQGTINIKNGVASATSKFNIKLKDYGIVVPKVVKDNISEKIDISVNTTFDQKM